MEHDRKTINSPVEIQRPLNVAELMLALDIGKNTAYKLIRSGQIRSIKIGKQYRIPVEAVTEFLSGSAV